MSGITLLKFLRACKIRLYIKDIIIKSPSAGNGTSSLQRRRAQCVQGTLWSCPLGHCYHRSIRQGPREVNLKEVYFPGLVTHCLGE